MSTNYYLGTSSADAVTLLPEKSYRAGKKQIRSVLRTRGGGLFLYTWGDYEKYKIPVDYMPASAASLVNSWWETNTELLFFVESGGATEVHSVMILNTDTPMDSHAPPYVDKYKGTIKQEGY